MEVLPGDELLANRWESVMNNGYRMWPGEYQSAVDSCGNPHKPWGGMNMAYFECCTGTPHVDESDDPRASAFVATELSTAEIAAKLMRSPFLQGKVLQVQVTPYTMLGTAAVRMKGSASFLTVVQMLSGFWLASNARIPHGGGVL